MGPVHIGKAKAVAWQSVDINQARLSQWPVFRCCCETENQHARQHHTFTQHALSCLVLGANRPFRSTFPGKKMRFAKSLSQSKMRDCASPIRNRASWVEGCLC